MMINTNHLLQYSLFLNEDLFLYCEEIDLCLRAKRYGLKIVIAGKSIVYHKGELSLSKTQKPINVYYIIRNRILLARKILDIKNQVVFWTLFVPARLIRCMKWVFQGKIDLVKITFSGLNDGIKGKIGKNNKSKFTKLKFIIWNLVLQD